MPMTSAAFILFTLYMIPDPATTPLRARNQVFFALGMATICGVLISAHVVFSLFIALFISSIVRACLRVLMVKTALPPQRPSGSASAA